MPLPFTHDQFLDVFAAYNRAFWPIAVLLWLLSALAVAQLYRRGAKASRLVTIVLAIHWAWSAIGYHIAFFRKINPSATLFGIAFLAEAALLTWAGIFRPQLRFTPSRSVWGGLAAVLIGFALVYPVLGLAFGLSLPTAPTFGVPCPTTILTIGLLLLVPVNQAWPVSIIPILWSAVGGSAAFLLGMRADLALIVAGVALVTRLALGYRGRGPWKRAADFADR